MKDFAGGYNCILACGCSQRITFLGRGIFQIRTRGSRPVSQLLGPQGLGCITSKGPPGPPQHSHMHSPGASPWHFHNMSRQLFLIWFCREAGWPLSAALLHPNPNPNQDRILAPSWWGREYQLRGWIRMHVEGHQVRFPPLPPFSHPQNIPRSLCSLNIHAPQHSSHTPPLPPLSTHCP